MKAAAPPGPHGDRCRRCGFSRWRSGPAEGVKPALSTLLNTEQLDAARRSRLASRAPFRMLGVPKSFVRQLSHFRCLGQLRQTHNERLIAWGWIEQLSH
jgi:hypothetical protein